VISLYTGATHFVEELFVKGIPHDGTTRKDFVHLYFIAHYFSYLSFLDLASYVNFLEHTKQDPKLDISRFEAIPDWFAVSYLGKPFQSYGFATDRHTGPIANPHPGFPERDCPERVGNSLSWQVFPCKSATCLHLFTRYDPILDPRPDESADEYRDRKMKEAKYELESQAGRAWFEFLYKPLWAEVAG
jgi:hypothetical protein